MNYYEVLQVSHNAEPETIEAAYKSLCKKYHPDKNHDPNSTKKMQEINEAYSVLHDKEKRERYDSWLSQNNSNLEGNKNGSSFIDILLDLGFAVDEYLGEVCPNCGNKSKIMQEKLSRTLTDYFTHKQKIKCHKCGATFIVDI